MMDSFPLYSWAKDSCPFVVDLYLLTMFVKSKFKYKKEVGSVDMY